MEHWLQNQGNMGSDNFVEYVDGDAAQIPVGTNIKAHPFSEGKVQAK